MVDERRNDLVRKVLLQPLDMPEGWTSRVHEWNHQESGAHVLPWAITAMYEAVRDGDGDDVLHLPLSVSYVEIAHYANDDELLKHVQDMRADTQRNQRRMITHLESRNGRRTAAGS